jgi:hypothetical protein
MEIIVQHRTVAMGMMERKNVLIHRGSDMT